MSYLVFFDLDGTLIKGQSQKYLVKYLFRKKKINVIFLIKIYLWFFLYKLNLVKDVVKIRREAFKLCKGWDIKSTEGLLKDFFKKFIIPNFFKESLKIIECHRIRGAKIILISSSLLPLVNIIGDYLKLDYIIATKLVINNGFYSGRIIEPIVYGYNKKIIVEEFIKSNGLSLVNSYCYADHYSDFQILDLVEHPIVINPDKKFFKIAFLKNWKIKTIEQ